jgi:hypothetical protein
VEKLLKIFTKMTLAIAMMVSVVWGQGNESFTNLPTTSSSSYLSRSWTGDDSVTWTAEGARTDQTITGKAICWGNSGTRNVVSPTYSGGMGTLSFNYVRAFTGTSARSLEVYVNNVKIGETITVSPTSNDVVTYNEEINVIGNVVLEIRSTGAAQVKVDDIEWTEYTSSGPSIITGTISSPPFCVNATGYTQGTVAYSATGEYNGAIFRAYLSDAVGNFDSPTDIGERTITGTDPEGTMNISIPPNTASGTGYKIRIDCADPAVTGSVSSAFEIILGAKAVSNQAASVADESSSLSWTNPDGCYDEIMIVGKAGSAVTATPSGDGSAYTANLTFASGTSFDGGYVLYRGTSSPQTVTNLTNGTAYYFTFFTRKGKMWSEGVTANATPFAIPNTWINEIHYDNEGADEGEFLELIVENASSYALSDFRVDLYNGSGGASYWNNTLDEFTQGSTYTEGGKTFTIYYFDVIIQNGAPDGMAISYDGTLIQFLSYEGTFTATDGPANGVTSTDIGISQPGNATNPVGSSIGLQGTGTKYSDFSWTTFATHTKGAKNTDQSLPVTLETFTAKATKAGVLLEWSTSAEIENSGFVIYRSEEDSPRPSLRGGVESEADHSTNSPSGEGAGDSPSERGLGGVLASYLTNNALVGQGSVTKSTHYSFTDSKVEAGRSYTYILSDVDFKGNETILAEAKVQVEVKGAIIADHYTLNPVYPNPFNASFTVPFILKEAMAVKIQLFDVKGRLAADILNGNLSQGSYHHQVNANNLGSGVYLLKMNLGGDAQMQKMVLVK